MMKSIIVFVVLISVVFATWTPISREDFARIREECFNEINVSAANRELIMQNKMPDEHEVYCYGRCLGLKTGTWDDRNGYNVDRVFALFDARDLVVSKENLQRCFSPVMDVDTCTWSAVNMKCLWENKYVTRRVKNTV